MQLETANTVMKNATRAEHVSGAENGAERAENGVSG